MFSTWKQKPNNKRIAQVLSVFLIAGVLFAFGGQVFVIGQTADELQQQKAEKQRALAAI